jgi:hypothetical protein
MTVYHARGNCANVLCNRGTNEGGITVILQQEDRFEDWSHWEHRIQFHGSVCGARMRTLACIKRAPVLVCRIRPGRPYQARD